MTREAGLQLLPFAKDIARHWMLDQPEVSLFAYRENAVFKVSVPNDCSFALRLHRPGYHSDASLKSELTWMNSLCDAGINLPAVQPTKEGDSLVSEVHPETGVRYQADLLSWIDGAPVSEAGRGMLKEPDRSRIFRAAGSLLARMHNFSASWIAPAEFIRHAWDQVGIVGNKSVWGDFRQLGTAAGEPARILEIAEKQLVARLSRLPRDQSAYGMIHADVNLDNLLRSGDEFYVIDFDDAGFGWYLFDLATLLYNFFGSRHFEPLLKLVVEGYRAERELSEDALETLVPLMLARGLTYLGWVSTRPETTVAIEHGPVFLKQALMLAKLVNDGSELEALYHVR